MSSPLAIELFCGVGGLGLGVQRAGFNTAIAIENDKNTARQHQINFPGGRTICTDVMALNGTDLVDLAAGRKVDLLFGGPPCQGFSIEGKRKTDDPRNQLAFKFVELVGEIKPQCFLIENVKGLALTKMRPILDELLANLRSSGYTVTWGLLNAKDYGVPQNRERIFILGVEGTSRPYLPISHRPVVTVRDAIADLPEPRDYISEFNSTFLGQDILPVRFKPGVYGSELNGSDREIEFLSGCKLSNHSEEVIARFQSTPPGKTEPVSRFPRLKWDGVSPTLKAGGSKEKGRHTPARPIHPNGSRTITAREAARLHSFPDSFDFTPGPYNGFRQVGNSVPPLLAEAVARELIKFC